MWFEFHLFPLVGTMYISSYHDVHGYLYYRIVFSQLCSFIKSNRSESTIDLLKFLIHNATNKNLVKLDVLLNTEEYILVDGASRT